MADLRDAMIDYRAKESISQGELAKRCNVNPSTIYSIESERHKPTAMTEAKIRRVIEKEE